MNREEALAIVKQQLTESRYLHTIGVTDTAVYLAKKYGADEKKAELAGVFHDYAKYRPKDEMKHIIKEQKMPELLLEFHSEMWHAPVGAYLVKKEVGIQDEEILSAIYYHTSGRANMTLLEKIIYVADYIEPGRDFSGVDEVRALAQQDLDIALLQAVKNTITFLLSKNAKIYPETLETYNHLVQKK